jgi:hypothetical protein
MPSDALPPGPIPPPRTEVKVAVIDDGCGGSYTAPAVTARMILPGWTTHPSGADSTRVSTTHQASITGRVLNCSDEWVKVLNVNISTGISMSFSLVPSAIEHLITIGCRVATLSLYGGATNTIVGTAANTFEAAGGVLICATSASNLTIGTADHASRLVVAACNPDGTVWSGADQGAFVDLCAIASGPTINATGGATVCTTAPSWAVGPVAGCIAMMFSVNSALTTANIRTILAATCVDLGTAGRDIYAGWGRLNAAAAISAARTFGT